MIFQIQKFQIAGDYIFEIVILIVLDAYEKLSLLV